MGVRGSVLTTDEHLGIRATVRGLVVGGVSLDGDTRQGLAVARESLPRGRHQPRLVCSQELARARGLTGCLAVPWERPFQLGKLAMSLSAAGAAPGSALIRLRVGDRDVLDARGAANPELAAWTVAPIPSVSVVIVDAQRAELDRQPAPWGTTLDRIQQAGGAVWDDPLLAWVAATQLVGQGHRVSVSAALRRAWKAHALAVPGDVRQRRQPALQLLSAREATARPVLAVIDPARPAPADARFVYASRLACGRQIDELVLQSGAVQVLAVGDGARALADRLASKGLQTTALSAALQQSLV